MEITEEQRKRAEANRLAAVEKRKRAAERSNDDVWRLFRCRKIPSPTTSTSSSSLSSDPSKQADPDPITKCYQPRPPPARFRIFIEICSPMEFSISPQPLNGFTFPGEFECFRRIDDSLSSVMPLRTIESQGTQTAAVFKIKDHGLVLRCLKTLLGVELQDIPHMTLSVVKKFQECIGNQWKPLWEGWYSDEQVDELLGKLPKTLRDALLPFQLDGVRFGLRRGGRCLIADEMGLGKTIQAIAIACCFHDEGPILVVCPAVLRFSWAEELEHWLPFLLPKDIHLVFGHQDNLNHMERSPKVVVISYTMLSRLRKSMLERKWALLIIDESHNIRCTKKKSESVETEVVLNMSVEVKHIILLSGTPSLSREPNKRDKDFSPRLIGKDKYEFAKNYCSMKVVQGCQGKIFKDFSKGIRLEELNVLLSQTLMIRRLKEHVLTQLPPKRRQIIRLKLKKTDMPLVASSRVNNGVCENKIRVNEFVMNSCSHQSERRNENLEELSGCHDEECPEKTPKQLSNQEIGLAKLTGFCEWFSHHAIRESESASRLHLELDCQKMVIFAHHLKVLDGIQEFICQKGIQFVRIDGSTLARDRQTAVENFRQSKEVKIAIIGITAGGVGLDFSSAQNVVFLELPKSASEMLQAEDRAHRRGQTNAVNIYIFYAKDTLDESRWLHLNKSLFRVSSLINGKEDAIQEIEVDGVLHLDYFMNSSGSANLDSGFNGENSVKGGTEAIKFHSGTTEECRVSTTLNIAEKKNSSMGTEPAQFETENGQDLNSEDCAMLHGNVEVSDSQTIHHGQPRMVSNCVVGKGAVGFDLMGNFVNKAESMHSVTNNVDDAASKLVEADTDGPLQLESLRFEVSQYTGRIHLYICVPGEDSRPRPLFVNFRPEDLESMVFSASDMKNETSQLLLKEHPACCKIFQTFSNEWSGLRPIEQNKLLGKPLQLPLSLELCYLKESINHGSGGLLKGESKRRITPLNSISSPLPENAVWKKVAVGRNTPKEKEYFQAQTITDEPLCKLCQQQCNGKLAKKPEYFEDLFCNLTCFQEYRIRTSQRALRQELFQIEHGVCTQCRLDCHKLVKCIKPLSIARRKEYIENVAPKLAKQKKLFDKLVYEPVEGNAWHADHIVPVYKGGGECSLENMRTLCVVCHAEVTRAQQKDRKLAKQRAKEQLKNALKELEDGDHIKRNNSALDSSIGNPGLTLVRLASFSRGQEGNLLAVIQIDMGTGEEEEAAEDDLLFVKVPGSAYSRTES